MARPDSQAVEIYSQIMTRSEKFDPLQAMKDKPSLGWAWYAAILVLAGGIFSVLTLFHPDRAGDFRILPLILIFALVAAFMGQVVLSHIHVAAKVDRLELRQFRHKHTIAYKDLARVVYTRDRVHSLHLETDTEHVTINGPPTSLMEEIGEITGWQTSPLVQKKDKIEHKRDDVVMFDAAEGDRVTSDAIISKKRNRSGLIATLVATLCIIGVVSLPLVHIAGLASAGEEAIYLLPPRVGVATYFTSIWPLIYLVFSPKSRLLTGYALALACIAAIALMIGHAGARVGGLDLIVRGLACFAFGLAVIEALRRIGNWLVASEEAWNAQYQAAIDAIIESGAVKDRARHWKP